VLLLVLVFCASTAGKSRLGMEEEEETPGFGKVGAPKEPMDTGNYSEKGRSVVIVMHGSILV